MSGRSRLVAFFRRLTGHRYRPQHTIRLNVELCRFFEEIKASLLIDGHLRAGPTRFVTIELIRRPSETRAVETALRTKAPAIVPASRCAPDPKPSRKTKKASRGKRRARR
jgi:hypothetical protein